MPRNKMKLKLKSNQKISLCLMLKRSLKKKKKNKLNSQLFRIKRLLQILMIKPVLIKWKEEKMMVMKIVMKMNGSNNQLVENKSRNSFNKILIESFVNNKAILKSKKLRKETKSKPKTLTKQLKCLIKQQVNLNPQPKSHSTKQLLVTLRKIGSVNGRRL